MSKFFRYDYSKARRLQYICSCEYYETQDVRTGAQLVVKDVGATILTYLAAFLL